MFYVLLYRSGIVPRWIAGWGLAAIPLVLAVWLIARGFHRHPAARRRRDAEPPGSARGGRMTA